MSDTTEHDERGWGCRSTLDDDGVQREVTNRHHERGRAALKPPARDLCDAFRATRPYGVGSGGTGTGGVGKPGPGMIGVTLPDGPLPPWTATRSGPVT